jgi:hypothetical protein
MRAARRRPFVQSLIEGNDRAGHGMADSVGDFERNRREVSSGCDRLTDSVLRDELCRLGVHGNNCELSAVVEFIRQAFTGITSPVFNGPAAICCLTIPSQLLRLSVVGTLTLLAEGVQVTTAPDEGTPLFMTSP